MARNGSDWLGTARNGSERLGMDRNSSGWLGMAWNGSEVLTWKLKSAVENVLGEAKEDLEVKVCNAECFLGSPHGNLEVEVCKNKIFFERTPKETSTTSCFQNRVKKNKKPN